MTTSPDTAIMPYNRPPITEAVIGINFVSPITDKELKKLDRKFHTYYPHGQVIPNYNIALVVHDQVTTNCEKRYGYRRSTADMTELVVFLPTSFVVSQLAPYKGWENFYDRFDRDWGLFKKTVGFQEVVRIGVRYINRIDIPNEMLGVEYDSFFNIYPKIPNKFPHPASYALQALVQLDEIGCLLKINSSVVPSPILHHTSFIIDQDISKEVKVPQSNNDIYELLHKIRVAKNAIFEACISDRTRELFK